MTDLLNHLYALRQDYRRMGLIPSAVPIGLALPVGCQANGCHQLIAARILQQKPAGSGSQSLVAKRRIDAYDDDLHDRRLLAQTTRKRHAIHPGTARVNKRDSRLVLAGKLKRSRPIGCGGDDFHVCHVVKQTQQGAADQRIAIHDEDANGRTLRYAHLMQ
jgi:hypothetical protein